MNVGCSVLVVLNNAELHFEAHKAVSRAIRKGSLLPQPCVVCGRRVVGGRKTEAHHPNYSEPLNIVWLCQQHHVAEHRRLSRLAHPPAKRDKPRRDQIRKSLRPEEIELLAGVKISVIARKFKITPQRVGQLKARLHLRKDRISA